MITIERVLAYVSQRFDEHDGSDRVEDRGFAYYIDTQPSEYLDTKDSSKMTFGNGPLVVLKETGDVYSFSSNPKHMFGSNRIGVNRAKTAEEFNVALHELKNSNDGSANPTDHIS